VFVAEPNDSTKPAIPHFTDFLLSPSDFGWIGGGESPFPANPFHHNRVLSRMNDGAKQERWDFLQSL
jgi:hypothetical protein